MTHKSWSNALALSLVVCLMTLSASAQTSGKTGSKYDKAKEVTLKGTVTQVVEPTGAGDPTVLTVKVSDKVVTVQLAPKAYLKEIDCWIKVGDTVEITGAKVTDSAEDVVARQVIFGNNTMVLRDEKGVPIWELWKPEKPGA